MLSALFSRHQLLSVILASTCYLCFAFNNTLINVVSYGAPQIVLTSTCLALLISLPIAVHNHESSARGYVFFSFLLYAAWNIAKNISTSFEHFVRLLACNLFSYYLILDSWFLILNTHCSILRSSPLCSDLTGTWSCFAPQSFAVASRLSFELVWPDRCRMRFRHHGFRQAGSSWKHHLSLRFTRDLDANLECYH